MSLENDLLGAFECHEPDEIRTVLKAGIDPNQPIKGKQPIDCLIEMYLRSERFADCLRVMLDAGATIDDPVLKSILLDDDQSLRRLMKSPGFKQEQKFNLPSTFTPLTGVTALHICAEYNSIRCARLLINAGANVNGRAAVDEDGFGGHTPIFHTVNSHRNFSRPMMELLAKSGAKLDVRLKGLVWGKGFDWETVLFDVTLFSYTQCGVMKQFQRSETDIADNLAFLYRKRFKTKAPIRNVPNRYLVG
ncbi:MAG: hypothetical protein U0798_14185 [Gemmataceae bacterium]